MSLREELIEQIGKMDRISLERVKSLLEWEAFDYSALPDVRVERTGEQVSEFKQLLRDLAQPDENSSAKMSKPKLERGPKSY